MGRGCRTGSLGRVFPDLADELWNGRPVALTASLVKLLDVVGGFGLAGISGRSVQKLADSPSWRDLQTDVQAKDSCCRGRRA